MSEPELLQRLVDSACELADAGYAALGIPDGEGGFRRFLVSGMSDELVERVYRVNVLAPLARSRTAWRS